MREGMGNTIAETKMFGCRLHGTVRDSVLAFPSGNTRAGTLAGESSALISGKASPWALIVDDTDNDVYLKNYAVLSWPAEVQDIKIYGKSAPFSGAPFIAPSGRVWWVGHVSGDATYGCSDATWQARCERFGLIATGAASDDHVVAFANPVAADSALNTKVARLWDCSPDGSRRIYKIGGQQTAFAWLEIVVSEVDATHVSVVANVLRSRSQTLGEYADSAPSTTPSGPLGESYQLGPSGTVQVGGLAPSFEYLPWQHRVSSGGSVYTDGSVPLGRTNAYSAQLVGYIASLNYDHAGMVVETLLDVTMQHVETENEPSASGTGGQKVTWSVVDQGGGNWLTTGGTFTAEASLSHTATIVAELAYVLRRGSDSVSHTARVDISKSFSAAASFSQAPSPATITSAQGNFDSAWTFSSIRSDTVTVTASGLSLPPLTFTTSDGDTQDVDYVAIQVGTSLPRAGSASVGPAVGDFWLTPPAERWQVLIETTMLCDANYFVASSLTGYRLYTKVLGRSNSLWGAYGAVIPYDTNTVQSAYEWALIGRNGAVTAGATSVAASYNAGASPPVSWELVHVSEQPATGEVVRGATTSERVGFV